MNLTPEQVKQFQAWANGKGYDIAHTYDTERSRWVFLNPMTADLFEAWQAALLRSAGDGWQDIATAPKDGTEILACWPKRKLDDDECPTGEITGYARCVTVWQGFWVEPDYLEAHGSFYFEDEAFAAEPTHWMPLPLPPVPGQEGEQP